MFSSSGGLHSLPQWIEVHNTSATESVDLKDWQLQIEVCDEIGEHRYGEVRFERLLIPPHQTALIVTYNGRHSTDISREIVYHLYTYDVFRTQEHPPRNGILGQMGFFVKLSDPTGIASDVAGNLDGDTSTSDAPAWKLPIGQTSEGFRTSLMRRYYHVTGIPLDGRASDNWRPAANLPLKVLTYWGRETDIGNPGHKSGSPLPVELSVFRAERTGPGEVVIKWTTASEKDNAGFNLLRGEKRQGRFMRLNAKLIAGSGTRSERQIYTWVDTTVKPGVMYYYRLEDVSFSGRQKQLATVRLGGNVSARGKLTTRWSELKQEK